MFLNEFPGAFEMHEHTIRTRKFFFKKKTTARYVRLENVCLLDYGKHVPAFGTQATGEQHPFRFHPSLQRCLLQVSSALCEGSH
jgi:hypothetical protein